MKVVVIGGTGLIGSKLVEKLNAEGHDATPAALQTGLNTLTNEGVDEAVAGAEVLVDVSNSPSFADDDVMHFFMTSTKNLLAAAVAAGVKHYVALSVVGTQRLGESGYFRAKSAQEELIQESSIPYSIVHATQFYEFLKGIADGATDGETVRVAPVLIQPIAADDVAAAMCRATVAEPVNGIVEVAGPEPYRLDRLIEAELQAHNDPRHVVADPGAKYFGATLTERMLLPGSDAVIGSTTIADWRAQQTKAA
jgi:uncharacterized protein YbjT (DUF2867 family)